MSDEQLTSAEQTALIAIVITVLVHFGLIFGLDTTKMTIEQKHLSQVSLLLEDKPIEEESVSELKRELAEIKETLYPSSNRASNSNAEIQSKESHKPKRSLNKSYMNSLPTEDFFDDKHINPSQKPKGLKDKIDKVSKQMGETGDKDSNKRIQNSSLVYDVKGRVGIHLESPVYLCDGSAIVRVQIQVTAFGSVSEARVVGNTSSNLCAEQTALRYAKEALFSRAERSTEGSITYTFYR